MRGKVCGHAEMGNGSKLQETGGPTPAGLLPCDFLPLLFPTRHACGALNLFSYYIRNGYITASRFRVVEFP